MTELTAIIDAIVALIILIGGLVTATLVQLARVKTALAAVAKDSRATVDQVANSHGTNLRDDLDDLAATMRRIETATDGLATDLRAERAARERLANDAHDSHAGIYQRLTRLEETKP